MNDLRILIADDEPLARRGLQQLLERHADCTVVAECRNGRETVRALRAARPDIAFLDIQMPGLNGLEVLDACSGELPPVIVFATAYEDFAVRAFDAHALDYLLKPITQERFDRMMDRARERLRARHALALSDQLAAFLGKSGFTPGVSPVIEPRSVVVPTGNGELVLDTTEIDWIEAEDYYAAVHALGRRHLIRESLASLERRLDPRQFVRVHRSAIARLDRVRQLREQDGAWMLVLRDGTEIPVSRRRRERVSDLLRLQ